MTTKIILDKAGRVVIPKSLRDELHLSPGDSLELESQGDHITIRPLRGTGPLQKEDGIWVFRIGVRLAALTTDELSEKLRTDRDFNNIRMPR